MRIHLLFLLTILFYCAEIFAQQNPVTKSEGYIVPIEFKVTRPLIELAKEFPVDENKPHKKGESKDKKHRVPQKFEFTGEDGPEYGNDPEKIQSEMGGIPGRAPIANWAGQTATGFRPYDPSGAPGPNHYIQMINSTTFKVYNKTTGAVLLTMTLGNLWSPATGNNGDPIVMYDKAADRWFLAQFGTSTDRRIYIAVSATSDPLGSYYTSTYTSPQFPDYLKFSVWWNGYYMTSNQSTQKVFCFERDAMLAGNPSARSVSVNYSPPKSGFFCPLPGDAADGILPPPGTPCPIFSYSDNGWGGGNIDAINIYNMSVDWVPATPVASISLAANVIPSAFDASYDPSWNDVSQPGTTQKLDGIGGVFMYRAQWKSWSGYNTIVLNWAVKISATQRSIKWAELRQNQSTGTWSLFQEGTYVPDAATRWMGGIAMDNNGSIGLSYMKSDATSIYPGLYYTGRRACDPLGTMPITETLVVAGTGYQTGTNRNGDYAQTSLDVDGITFWHTSEYMGGSSGGSAARTRIFSYQIQPCTNDASVSIVLTSGTNPTCNGQTLTFTAFPVNGGSTPSYQWKVDGVNAGSNSPTFTTSSILNGQSVTCEMTSSQAGVGNNPATSNAITVAVNSNVTPSVSITQTAGSNPSCQYSLLSFTASPVNGGSTPSYQWKINGSNVGTNNSVYSSSTINNGEVITCEMTSVALCASPVVVSSNSITMTINGPSNPTVSIIQSGGSNPSCQGESLTFVANILDGVNPVYQWKVDGGSVGTNSPNFSSSGLLDGQVVSCDVTLEPECPAINSFTLGTGTLLNATNSSVAIAYPTYYGNGRQQFLVRASELISLGMGPGDITSLGFNVAGTVGNPSTLNGYTIKLAHTSSTVMSSAFLTPIFTTVFGPVNYTPILNSVNTHNFTNLFNWDGSSNIVVDICFSNQVTGTVAYQNYQTNSSFVSNVYYRADGAGGAGACNTTTVNGTASRRPNMIFGIGTSTVDISSNQITLDVVSPPAISSFTPASGTQGTVITIYGSNFSGINDVIFNSVPASSFSVISASEINATVPNTTTGDLQIVSNLCGPVSAGIFTVNQTPISLVLKIFIEGFYTGSGKMRGILGPNTTDTVTLEVRSASAPYSLIEAKKSTVSNIGIGTFVFNNVPLGSSGYLKVVHRNALETWSAAPVLFDATPKGYDFTNAVSKAFGNNLRNLGDGFYALWSGDVNQDGVIDDLDFSDIESAIFMYGNGYIPEDLDGNMIVESADFSLIENNSQLLLILSRP
ncbi:MAG: hypothetical protein DWQ48_06850 [Bacteroidetes bacterium]|nr:MAG: hypothetical protein DWQ48_06850 [Bacteroidota bacterium]